MRAQLDAQAVGDAHDDLGLHGQAGAAQLARQPVRVDHEPLGRVQAEVDDPPQARARRRLVERFDGDAGLGHPVAGQIDPIEVAVVVLAVLQMVEHLQGAAKAVRGGVARRVLAVQVQEIASHRVGRLLAISQKIGPVVVTQLGRVALEGGDDVDAVPRRDAGLQQALADPVGRGQGGIVGHLAEHGLLEAIEPRDLVFGFQVGVVGDVVDGAGEGVELGDVRAQRGRQEERAHLEVLVVGSLAGGRLNPADAGRCCRCLFHFPGRSLAARRPAFQIPAAGRCRGLGPALPQAAPPPAVLNRRVDGHGRVERARHR